LSSIASEDASHWIEILREGTHEEKKEVREALIALGGEAVPLLIAATRDPNYLVRWEAVNTLGAIALNDPLSAVPAIPALTERALTDEIGHPRWRSLWALTTFGDEIAATEIVPLLRVGLEDPHVEHRWYAAVALALFKQSEAAEYLNRGLDRADWYDRWEAVFCLGLVHNAESLPLVIDILLDALNADELLRKEAALTLGKMSDLAAVPALIVALGDPSPGVRCRVALSLKNLAGTSALPELEAALEREDDQFARKQMERIIDELQRRA